MSALRVILVIWVVNGVCSTCKFLSIFMKAATDFEQALVVLCTGLLGVGVAVAFLIVDLRSKN